jgi:hypothetical protein
LRILAAKGTNLLLAAQSRIITSAHRINQGSIPDLNPPGTESDFYFVQADDPETAEAGRALGLTTYLVETGYGAKEKHETNATYRRSGFTRGRPSHCAGMTEGSDLIAVRFSSCFLALHTLRVRSLSLQLPSR